MGLFKGLTASKERQKAKAFYEKALHLTGNPREIRRVKAIIGNRTKAFFNMTFVEGAKKTEAHQKSLAEAQIAGKQEPQEPFSSAYKQVKTVGGTIWVYIPQQVTNKIFNLGSKYQLEMITKGQAIEVGQSIADELADSAAPFAQIGMDIVFPYLRNGKLVKKIQLRPFDMQVASQG